MLWEALVAFSFLGWLILSAWVQLGYRGSNLLSRMCLLPNWRFFGPNPLTSDLHLLFRTVTVDGNSSIWREVGPQGARPLRSAIWNPERRVRKALFDIVVSLSKEAEESSAHIQASVPYIALLSIVVGIGREADTHKIQYCVLERCYLAPTAMPSVIFCSYLHRVE